MTRSSVLRGPETPDHLTSQNQMLQHLLWQIVSCLDCVQTKLASAALFNPSVPAGVFLFPLVRGLL